MKKKQIIPINAINLAVIVSVTIFIAILTQNIIKKLTVADIENVTRLTYTNIYAELQKELIEPVNTAVIMAQNTLLFDFMNQDTDETERKMAEYLSSIQSVTGYESVFVVPHSTLNYYHPGGTDAKVDLSSEESFWYSSRMDAQDSYEVVVNTEQLDQFALTVYVDANMEDRNGNFAGVAGVGKRITHLQKILTNYLENQGVEAYLTDEEGLVLIHQDTDYIKKVSFYELEDISLDVVDLKDSREKTIEKLMDNRFYIIQYVPMLNWYLVVKKSSSDLTGILNHYNSTIMTALVLGALILLLVTNYVISMYKKQIMYLSNIDHLTDIPNRTIFEIRLQEYMDNSQNKDFCLALFDLDNLKAVNDSYGHDKGDEILKEIASTAKDIFVSPNFVYRVGGDEFAVIINQSPEEAKFLLESFREAIKNNAMLQTVESTVSVGVAKSRAEDTKDAIFKRADEALYQVKNSGKDRIHFS